MSPEVQNKGISGPHKKHLCPQKKFLKKFDENTKMVDGLGKTSDTIYKNGVQWWMVLEDLLTYKMGFGTVVSGVGRCILNGSVRGRVSSWR